MAIKKLKMSFFGGAGTVTGANFLLEDPDSDLKILLDCGLLQGEGSDDEKNRNPFPYDPKTITYLFISHTHIDHVGLIPRLVKEGFSGKIYSTPPTKEISEVVLLDSMGILGKEAKKAGKEPLYAEEDVKRSIELWETFGYHEEYEFPEGFHLNFRDSGHVLGSAMIEIIINGKKFVYTGDLGNSPSPLLHDTEVIDDATYLVMESVYGDRNHEPHDVAKNTLEDTIEETVLAGGTLMIPAFSIEKTQEILFELKEMVMNGRIPLVRTYLDSPLAIKVTDIYKKYAGDYLNQEASGGDGKLIKESGLFNFPQLVLTEKTEESQKIKDYNHPKIIIAGSGMSNGGRIIHHEKNYLPDRRSALLLAGYQAVGTPGRLLQEGAKNIKILGENVQVRARIISVTGYSAHKGMDDLMDFVANTADSVKLVYVALGEPKSSLHLVQRIRDYLAVDAESPQYGETRILEF